MAENNGTYTIESYLRGVVPNASLSDDAIIGILIDAQVEPGTPMYDVTERQKDVATAYLYIRLAANPISSMSTSERDADWQSNKGSEQWSRSQLSQFLVLARTLLKKWGITDSALDAACPKWGVSGRGFHTIRRYK